MRTRAGKIIASFRINENPGIVRKRPGNGPLKPGEWDKIKLAKFKLMRQEAVAEGKVEFHFCGTTYLTDHCGLLIRHLERKLMNAPDDTVITEALEKKWRVMFKDAAGIDGIQVVAAENQNDAKDIARRTNREIRQIGDVELMPDAHEFDKEKDDE